MSSRSARFDSMLVRLSRALGLLPRGQGCFLPRDVGRNMEKRSRESAFSLEVESISC